MTLTADHILRRFEEAKSERSTWDGHAQETADLVLPTRDFTVQNQTQGIKRHNKIFNSTAPEAAKSLAAAKHGLLINQANRWFEAGIDDLDVEADSDELRFLYKGTTKALSFLASSQSGFMLSSMEAYQDQVVFGCAVETAMEVNGVLKFQARPLASFWVLEGDDGLVCDQFRESKMTIREAAVKFGAENLSEDSQRKLKDDKQQNEKISIVHYVGKRTEYDPESYKAINKPWASCYLEYKSDSKGTLISESGFDENPFLFSRWDKAPGETYGRGPAMDNLAHIKTINAMTRTALMAGELATRPPMFVPAGTLEGPVRTAPGGLMYGAAGSRNGVKPEALFTGSDPRVGWEQIAIVKKEIEKAFFFDAFTLPELDRMTAEEVITRRQQGLIKASPLLSREYTERLNPVIARTFSWLAKTGRLYENNPMPASLRGRRWVANYVSPMAIAQKASEGMNFLQFMAAAAQLLQGDPTALVGVNSDTAVQDLAAIYHVNPKLIRKAAEVKAIRANQERMAQLGQQVALAQGGAAALKDAAAGAVDLRGAAA